MPEFSIGDKVMHGDAPVVVKFAFAGNSERVYVERGDRCIYRVLKSALTKGEPVKPPKPKK